MRIQAARRLSHSTRLLLHKCPRLFILQRLQNDREESVHLSFGSSFGVGFQSLMLGEDIKQAVWKAFLVWDIDLLEELPRDKKSFFDVVSMLDKFSRLKDEFFTDKGWEVAYFNGQPAVELGARINFHDDFYYLLFIDLVMINKNTNELKVLELKTTKYDDPSPALYANSGQATLYSVFLDAIAKQYHIEAYSSYEVLYFVVSTVSRSFNPFQFKKTRLKKAIALRDISMDIEHIQEYERIDFPMYGESCYNYASHKDCPKFGICHMAIENIVCMTEEQLAEWEPKRKENPIHFELSASDLIDVQLKELQQVNG